MSLIKKPSAGSSTPGTTYMTVANFAELPSAGAHAGEIYVCLAAQGIWFINRKEAGLWRSNGTAWAYIGSDVETTSLLHGTTKVVGSPIELVGAGTIIITPDADNSKVTIEDAAIPQSYLKTTITNSDTNVPSSGAVVDYYAKFAGVNAQTGITYSIVATDLAKLVTLNNEDAIACTLPTPTSLGLVALQYVAFRQLGAGRVTFVAGEDAVMQSYGNAYKIAGQYGMGYAVVVDGTTWALSGELAV